MTFRIRSETEMSYDNNKRQISVKICSKHYKIIKLSVSVVSFRKIYKIVFLKSKILFINQINFAELACASHRQSAVTWRRCARVCAAGVAQWLELSLFMQFSVIRITVNYSLANFTQSRCPPRVNSVILYASSSWFSQGNRAVSRGQIIAPPSYIFNIQF